MNIAFPTFFILCLIFPGYILLKSLSKKENTSVEHYGLDSSFVQALIISILIHLLSLFVVKKIGYNVIIEICIKILTGKDLSTTELTIISESSLQIALYFIIVFISSFLLGKLIQKIFLLIFPYKESFLSFDTPWFYELRGMISKDKKADITKVSCLVNLNEGSYLYYGILQQFYLNKDGSLDRIIIEEAMRRKIENDEASATDGETSVDDRYYRIKGDKIILKYSDIKNINLEYYIIEPTLEEENNTQVIEE